MSDVTHSFGTRRNSVSTVTPRYGASQAKKTASPKSSNVLLTKHSQPFLG